MKSRSPKTKRINPQSKYVKAMLDPNDPIIGSFQQSVLLKEVNFRRGNLSAAAKALGITKVTMEKYVTKSKPLQELCKSIMDEEIDHVEQQLHGQIDKGNLQAILFYLKCKGRDRGWIEKTDINVDMTKPITFKYTLAKGKGKGVRKNETDGGTAS